MKLSFNLLFQIAALIVQFGNMVSGYLPLKYQAVVLLIVGIAQSLVSYRAHKFNPDGTPAAVPFDPYAEARNRLAQRMSPSSPNESQADDGSRLRQATKGGDDEFLG